MSQNSNVISMATAPDFAALRWLLLSAKLPTVGVEPELGAFFVAHVHGNLVACAGLEQHAQVGLLRSVVVHPEHRGRGLASALVGAVIELARQRGLSELYLLTETAPRFFEAKGFAVIARKEAPDRIQQSWEFRLGCPTSAHVMRRSLPS